MTRTLADYNSARNHLARNKLFQTLGFHFLVSRHGTKSEEGVARKEGQIEVARLKFLKTNEQEGVMRFHGRRNARTCL